MVSNERLLDDLVSRWQREAEQGRHVPPAELCRDQPDLLPELERRVEVLRRVGNLARPGPQDPDTTNSFQAQAAPTVTASRAAEAPACRAIRC
jgi:hypothetical protein